jgi:L-Ala-D/L-Glu epimerase
MQITHITCYAFDIPMTPFVISLGTITKAQNILIRVRTDEGITGWGEGAPFSFIVGETQGTALALAKDFSLLWKHKDPLAIEDRMKELHQYVPFNTTVKSAFDMALYDIAAQHAGMPLYRFLGGEKRVLITDETLVIGSPEEMAGRARQLQEQGASFIKVKLGKGNDAQGDIARIKAIRAAIGSDILLRLDANQGWTTDVALQVLTALKDDNIQFCEQPVAARDYAGLKAVHEASPIPIMADEACFDSGHAEALIAQKACSYLNIKLAKSSGMLEAASIARIAAANGMSCMLGGMIESRLALTANAHFACAFPNLVFFDLDFCFPHTMDPVTHGVRFENRYTLHVPDTPGIGAGVDDHFLANCIHFTA